MWDAVGVEGSVLGGPAATSLCSKGQMGYTHQAQSAYHSNEQTTRQLIAVGLFMTEVMLCSLTVSLGIWTKFGRHIQLLPCWQLVVVVYDTPHTTLLRCWLVITIVVSVFARASFAVPVLYFALWG